MHKVTCLECNHPKSHHDTKSGMCLCGRVFASVKKQKVKKQKAKYESLDVATESDTDAIIRILNEAPKGGYSIASIIHRTSKTGPIVIAGCRELVKAGRCTSRLSMVGNIEMIELMR